MLKENEYLYPRETMLVHGEYRGHDHPDEFGSSKLARRFKPDAKVHAGAITWPREGDTLWFGDLKPDNKPDG